MPTKNKAIDQKLDEYNSIVIIPQTHNLPLQERQTAGRALRKVCARSAHAAWEPPPDRPDPIDLLIENSMGRMQELVPIRFGRMAANPFAFYRGAAIIMASDLSCTPSTGLKIAICGDCHLLNFGGFATAERQLIFDINDFDEVSIAPWEWDIKRLAASFVIAGRFNGFSDTDNREAAFQAAQSYRLNISQFAAMPVLDAWYDAIDMNEIISNIQNKDLKRFYTKKLLQATEQSAHEKEFAKLAYISGDSPKILDQPPLIFHYQDVRDQEIQSRVQKSIRDYLSSLSPEKRLLLSRYQLVDTAFKVVGVGSVGTFCGIALFMSGNGDPLFLQFKQARQSVLEPYAGTSTYDHAGKRVVVGQKVMQAATDIFLGWYTGLGDQQLHYYVRQLKDAKIKPVVEVMDQRSLKNYAALCGRGLSRAHARSGDAVVLSGYMGKNTVFEDAIADFSLAYADQNERDHAVLIDAIRSGKVDAHMEE